MIQDPYKSLTDLLQVDFRKMAFDPTAIGPIVDVKAFVQMTQHEFISFVFDYMLKTKVGLASIDLCWSGEFDSAETICHQWINLLDAITVRNEELIQGIIPGVKAVQIGCLGMIQLYRANYRAAEELYTQALSLVEEIGDLEGADNYHMGKAVSFLRQGRFAQVIEECEKAWEKNTATGNISGIRGAILTTMGCGYHASGQMEKAVSLHLQAVDEMENEGKSKIIALNNLAAVLMDNGDYQDAKDVLINALGDQQAISNISNHVILLTNLGKVEFFLGNTDAALENYKLGLELSSEHLLLWEYRGLLVSIGELLVLAESDPEAALTFFQEALAECRKSSDVDNLIASLTYLGFLYDNFFENFAEAKTFYEEAVAQFEQQRLLMGADHFRISFSGKNQYLYDLLISLCLKMGDVENALVYLEKCKSKALIDAMLKSLGVSGGLSLASSFGNEIQTLWEEIGDARQTLEILYRRISANGNYMQMHGSEIPGDSPEEIEQRLDEAEARYLDLLQTMQTKNRPLANQLDVPVLSVQKLLERLDHSTILVQFYQTAETLILFFISKQNGVQYSTIQLEAMDAFSEVQEVLEEIGDVHNTSVKSHEFLRNVRNRLARLHQVFLPSFEQHIGNARYIIFVPYSFWHFFPMHALYDRQQKQYLIDQYAISYLPASSMLELPRGVPDASVHNAVMFGNPAGDLPYASEEIARISQNFQTVEVFEGVQATVENFVRASANVRYLHLATHGVFRIDNPMLSFVELMGVDSTPIRLLATEIMNLRFSSTLVALSGCETGLSSVLPGDEVMGLTRAFLVAGADSLLCSLWRVEDESTADLMQRFYTGILQDDQAKPESLRRAIIELKNQPGYAHPFFWAPFILLGR